MSRPPVRMADPADLPRIRDIAFRTWPSAYGAILSDSQLTYMLELFYSLPALEQQLYTDGHQFLLAESQDGTATGFASYSPIEHNGYDETLFKLHKLYVLPECQHQGWGGRLLENMESRLGAGSGCRLRLNVNRFNPALGFYRKHGFQIIREEDIDIGNGYFMNDFVLEKLV